MELPTTLDKFTLWLIEQSFITSEAWKADDNVWLLDAVCKFNPDKHQYQHTKGKSQWDSDYHQNCALAIGVKIKSGGVEGGSCWDDSNPQEYHISYTLPDLTNLVINIIGEFFPDVTLVQYTKNFTNLVCKGEYTNYEYYGNRDDYATAYVTVESLYNALKALEK